MPFINNDDQDIIKNPVVETQAEEGVDPSFLDVLGASFSIDNTLGSAIAGSRRIDNEKLDPNFNLTDHLMRAQIPLDEYDDFSDIFNESAFNQRLKGKEREKADRQMIADAGLTGLFTSFLAGASDPVNFVPIAGQAARIAKGGKTALKAAKDSAAVAAPTIALAEGLLGATQTERSIEEMTANTAAGIAFSAALGAGVQALTKDPVKLKKDISKEILEFEEKSTKQLTEITENFTNHKDAGAAANTQKLVDADSELASNPIFDTFVKFNTATKMSPMLRALNNPNPEIREAYLSTFTSAYKTQGDTTEVLGQAVEDIAKSKYPVIENEAITGYEQAFKAYRKQADSGKRAPMTREEFDRATFLAIDEGRTTGIKEIDQAAKAWEINQKFIENEYKSIGMLDEGNATNNHIAYKFVKENIIEDEALGSHKFRGAMRRHLTKKYQTEVNRLDRELAELQAQTATKAITKRIDEIEDLLRTKPESVEELQDYIEDSVTNIINNIKGSTGNGPLNIGKASDIGILKNSPIDVPAKDIIDFLDTNLTGLTSRMNRMAAPEIELIRKHGTANFDTYAKKLREDHSARMKEVTDVVEREKRIREFESGLDDMKHMWNIFKGKPRDAIDADSWIAKSLHNMRSWAFMTMLGRVTMNSVGDIARLVVRQGVGGYNPIAARLVNRFKDPELKAAIQRDNKYLQVGLEIATNNRIATTFNLDDHISHRGRITRAADAASAMSAKVFGITHWNDFMKQAASVATQNKMIDIIGRGAKASTKDQEYMTFLGLSKSMQNRIGKQLDEHSEFRGTSSALAHYDKWTDKQAREAFLTAIKKEADLTIITPGVGDKPFVMTNSIGKTFTQFLSFGFASNNRMLGALLQDADAEKIFGTMLGITAGMGIYLLQEMDRGADIDKIDPLTIATRGLDKSGLLSVPFFMNSFAEEAGVGIGDLSGALFGTNTSHTKRYNRDIVDQLVGPTGSLVKKVTRLPSIVEKGIDPDKEITQSDYKAMRSLVPLQNALGLGSLIRRGEEHLFKEFKVPQRNKPKAE